MSRRTEPLTDELYDYLLRVSLREPEILRRLREETGALEKAGMQISPEQGQFMALLIELMGARRTLEIGTFTGYSALVVALELPPDGRIVACDVSEEWTAVARRYWEEAGVAHMIDLRLGPAVGTLESLLGEGRRNEFDFAFIDADKGNYQAYFDLALELVRPGGLIAIDNTLWHGQVIDPAATDGDTEAIRRFNVQLKSDERVALSLVPIGDGLSLARKRATSGEAQSHPADALDALSRLNAPTGDIRDMVSLRSSEQDTADGNDAIEEDRQRRHRHVRGDD